MTILAGVLAAAAVTAQIYPAQLDRESLTAWLREAEMAPEQVVAVSASAATALVEHTTEGKGRVQVRLRALALTPDAARRSGVTAWEMPLEIDCPGRQVRPGETTGYPARTSMADGVALAPGETEWRRPNPGTTLESAWRAVCDAGFRPPLAAEIGRVAKAPVAPAPRATPVVRATAATAVAHDSVATVPDRIASPKLGRAAVQLVSSPVEADTRQTLERLKRRHGELAGMQARVETAQVGGRTVYRGVVAGFASRSDAQNFCRALTQRGQPCLAR